MILNLNILDLYPLSRTALEGKQQDSTIVDSTAAGGIKTADNAAKTAGVNIATGVNDDIKIARNGAKTPDVNNSNNNIIGEEDVKKKVRGNIFHNETIKGRKLCLSYFSCRAPNS